VRCLTVNQSSSRNHFRAAQAIATHAIWAAFVLASRVKSVLRLDELDALSQCDVPMLYLRGTEDRLVPDAAWRGMSAARPMTTSHMPGPHMLLQTNPTGAWKATMEFLARQG
jgi:pimeloyl-ACP methyl ester carboxylesterase